jgi:hypothetical protein
MFSFSYYYLQFSRVGWTNIHTITLGLLLILLVELAINKNRILFYLISGILGGLLTYTYRSGEIFILASLIMFLSNMIISKIHFTKKIINLSIFLLVFLLISWPWINKILGNWNLYNLRADAVSIGNVKFPYHELYEQNKIIQYQIAATFKSWILLNTINNNAGNTENARYLPLRRPIISPTLIPFFWTGIIIAFKKWRKSFIWLFIFFSGLIFGQIMTVDPPNGSRGLLLLPVMYIFIGYSLNYFYKIMKNIKYINILLILFSIIITITDFLYYQYWMTWIKV